MNKPIKRARSASHSRPQFTAVGEFRYPQFLWLHAVPYVIVGAVQVSANMENIRA
jgi:hypothetical protein